MDFFERRLGHCFQLLCLNRYFSVLSSEIEPMNAGSLFTPKKNIYTVKYGPRKDAGSFRGPIPEGAQVPHRCLHCRPTSPPRGLLPSLCRGPCGQGLARDAPRAHPDVPPRCPARGRSRVGNGRVLPSKPFFWPRKPGYSASRAPGGEPLSGLTLGLLFPGAPLPKLGSDPCSWPARPRADPESLGMACLPSDVPRTCCSLAGPRRGHVPAAWTPRPARGLSARTFLPAG